MTFAKNIRPSCDKLYFCSAHPKTVMLFFAVFFGGPSCSNETLENQTKRTKPDYSKTQILAGEINESFVSVTNNIKPESYLVVTSEGGNVNLGLASGKNLLNKNIKGEVIGMCLSACAEYVLPALTDINMIDNPVIGYHWSPQMITHLHVIYTKRDLEHCKNLGANHQAEFLRNAGKPTNSWQETLKRIKLKEYKPEYRMGKCPRSIRSFEHEFWYPTSKQLREIFGLSFDGTVCADSDACISKKIIPNHQRRRTSFVSGDKVYLTNQD